MTCPDCGLADLDGRPIHRHDCPRCVRTPAPTRRAIAKTYFPSFELSLYWPLRRRRFQIPWLEIGIAIAGGLVAGGLILVIGWHS